MAFPPLLAPMGILDESGGVLAVVQPDGSLYVSPGGAADVREVFQRALNTWENRPAWLVELADVLNAASR